MRRTRADVEEVQDAVEHRPAGKRRRTRRPPAQQTVRVGVGGPRARALSQEALELVTDHEQSGAAAALEPGGVRGDDAHQLVLQAEDAHRLRHEHVVPVAGLGLQVGVHGERRLRLEPEIGRRGVEHEERRAGDEGRAQPADRPGAAAPRGVPVAQGEEGDCRRPASDEHARDVSRGVAHGARVRRLDRGKPEPRRGGRGEHGGRHRARRAPDIGQARPGRQEGDVEREGQRRERHVPGQREQAVERRSRDDARDPRARQREQERESQLDDDRAGDGRDDAPSAVEQGRVEERHLPREPGGAARRRVQEAGVELRQPGRRVEHDRLDAQERRERRPQRRGVRQAPAAREAGREHGEHADARDEGEQRVVADGREVARHDGRLHRRQRGEGPGRRRPQQDHRRREHDERVRVEQLEAPPPELVGEQGQRERRREQRERPRPAVGLRRSVDEVHHG